jgi:hypothetical protein
LADVSLAVLPALAKHGLSFTSQPTVVDGSFVLEYQLRHSSGESITGAYPLPDKGTPQSMGSAITYARRYALSAVTGVAPDKDDDGAAASVETRFDRHREPEHQQRREPEPAWDPIEQETLVTSWMAEIEDAKTAEEISDIGRRLLKAKRDKELSSDSYEKLAVTGGTRKRQLADAPVPAQPAALNGASR